MKPAMTDPTVTTDWRALCAELLEALENAIRVVLFEDGTKHISTADPTIAKADAALAQPEPQGPTNEELTLFAVEWWASFAHLEHGADTATPINEIIHSWHFVDFLKDTLRRWGRPAIEPVPVSERFEFSVLDSECVEQAGGTASTYSQALSEGQHYLAVYSQDGPHTLELRRVQVLPHHALPVPQQEATDGP